jgi:hypothetical protein
MFCLPKLSPEKWSLNNLIITVGQVLWASCLIHGHWRVTFKNIVVYTCNKKALRKLWPSILFLVTSAYRFT